MAIKAETLAQHAERCYQTEDWDDLAAIYAPDVLLDVHVPSWRFQLQGRDTAIGWFKEQVARFENFHVTWVSANPTEGGVVVEWEMRTGDDDNEQLCREVDILHGDGARIHTHVIWCTGMWDPATIVRQRAE